ncbi:unnamed protein product [Mytilus coruscus]|uniref:Uncharacterized protein n=1 Tax=Mytilus coruscus TaxID=42192 RepID=A0A6J8AN98_MYTCO|nr:unnamed protein product [Mytilus coruscus]
MSPSDLDETSAEISEWDEFYTSVTKYGFSKTFSKENIVLPDMSLDEGEDDVCKTDVWEKVCEKKKEIFTFFTDDLLEEYNTWRHENSSVNQTFAFWDNFVHLDFMAYLGLFFSIRCRNWHLRNVSLKKITCLFHAFDRQNYQRLIPYHLADLHTFPEPVIKHFAAGCFSVSISGKHLYSVVLDEAHEMEINLKSKNALNSFSQSSLANLTFYLPYRAKTLHNLKSELQLEREEGLYQREGTMSYVKNAEKTKKIAFSKHSGNAVKDLDQFLQLPRALCDAEGIPEKGQKATAANVFKSIYSDAFLLQVPKAPVSNKTTVIIDAGGFDDDRKDRAISILNGQVVDYDLASGNHEEADTRVWLHASVTTANQVIIYSPDTDVFFIGLPLVPNLTKTVYVQLRDSRYNNSFLSMDKLVKCITLNDSLLQGIDSILICSGDQVLDMSIDLDDVISDETEDLEDPVEDEQPEVDGLVEELDQTDDYWLFSNEEI